MVMNYLRNPAQYPDYEVQALTRCANAPFLLPSKGFIGYLWNDSFKPFNRHQGIDIFAGTDAGKTPVYAPYDGFLTREEGWRSSIIIRIPQDPLDPSRQIWLYMTHMADPEGNSFIDSAFPPGTYDKPVFTGDLLGFQGNYSGDPARPVGVHLHFRSSRMTATGITSMSLILPIHSTPRRILVSNSMQKCSGSQKFPGVHHKVSPIGE